MYIYTYNLKPQPHQVNIHIYIYTHTHTQAAINQAINHNIPITHDMPTVSLFGWLNPSGRSPVNRASLFAMAMADAGECVAWSSQFCVHILEICDKNGKYTRGKISVEKHGKSTRFPL